MNPWIARNARARTLVVAAILVGAAGWTTMGLHRPARVAVETNQVTLGPIVHRIVATGTLQPIATVQVGAQVSGTVQTLYADYNSIVHKDQVLARLDPALLQAALGEAEAALAQAEAAVGQARASRAGLDTAAIDAQTKLTRAQQLAARQVIPQSDLDAAQIAMSDASAALRSGDAQVAQALAEVDQARAQVGQARVNLDHTVITSPIDGIVVSREVDVGQTVAAAVQAPVLFDIATDFSRMQVEVNVDEADVGGLQPGEPATFQVESYPDETFHGVVTQIRLQPVAAQTTTATTVGAPATTTTTIAAVVSYATMIVVENPLEKLRPGMTATVALNGSRVERTLRIPTAALSFRPPPEVLAAIKQSPEDAQTSVRNDATHRRVWTFDGTQFAPIDLRTGLSDGQWTEAVDGSLRDGDALVTRASLRSAQN